MLRCLYCLEVHHVCQYCLLSLILFVFTHGAMLNLPVVVVHSIHHVCTFCMGKQTSSLQHPAIVYLFFACNENFYQPRPST